MACSRAHDTRRVRQRPPAPPEPGGRRPPTTAEPPLPKPPPTPHPPPTQSAGQHSPRPAPSGQRAQSTPEELCAVRATLGEAQKDRTQARVDRMNQCKAARAAEEQQLYRDWHDGYLADTPVRVE